MPLASERGCRCAGIDGLGIVVGMNAVILVEGDSDKAALQTLATRFGRDLVVEGVSVVSMGGASSIGNFLADTLATVPVGTTLAGLCDEAEAAQFCLALESAGIGSDISVSDMDGVGFFVCRRDLEDELIRSLGADAIEGILVDQGELKKFRKFQNQLEWRGKPLEDQFHRFSGIKSGRKVRYGRVLVEALDLRRVPPPLEGVLSFVEERA
jgi:hypothetical protein